MYIILILSKSITFAFATMASSGDKPLFSFTKRYGTGHIPSGRKTNILSALLIKEKYESGRSFSKKIVCLERVLKHIKSYFPYFYLRLYANREAIEESHFVSRFSNPLMRKVQLVEFEHNRFKEAPENFKSALDKFVKFYPLFDFDESDDVRHVIVIDINLRNSKAKRLANFYRSSSSDFSFMSNLFYAPFCSNETRRNDFFNCLDKNIILKSTKKFSSSILTGYIESLYSSSLSDKDLLPEGLINSVLIPFVQDTGLSLGAYVNFEITAPFYYLISHHYEPTEDQMITLDKDLEYILDSSDGNIKEKFKAFDKMFYNHKGKNLKEYKGDIVPVVDRFYEVINRWKEIGNSPFPEFVLDKILEKEKDKDKKIYWAYIFMYEGNCFIGTDDMSNLLSTIE